MSLNNFSLKPENFMEVLFAAGRGRGRDLSPEAPVLVSSVSVRAAGSFFSCLVSVCVCVCLCVCVFQSV